MTLRDLAEIVSDVWDIRDAGLADELRDRLSAVRRKYVRTRPAAPDPRDDLDAAVLAEMVPAELASRADVQAVVLRLRDRMTMALRQEICDVHRLAVQRLGRNGEFPA